jgi:hypothetical protein
MVLDLHVLDIVAGGTTAEVGMRPNAMIMGHYFGGVEIKFGPKQKGIELVELNCLSRDVINRSNQHRPEDRSAARAVLLEVKFLLISICDFFTACT